MLHRSKFSNKMLLGLMSLGLVGAIATAPTPSSATPATDSTSSTERPSNTSGNSVTQPSAMTSQSGMAAPQANGVSAQTGALRPSNKVTERGGAIVAPGINLSDYSDSRRLQLSLTNSSMYAPTASAAGSDSGSSRVSELPVNSGTNGGANSGSPVMNGTTERDGAVRAPEAGTSQTLDTRNQSLGQLVSGNADFSTLETAIKAAELESAFEGTEPVTVFAPTNEAFAALPADALRKLLLPENREALRQILTYHVVQGNLTSNAIQAGDVSTAEGSSVMLTNNSGKVTVAGATVTQADIVARNGIIHAIDQVLLPPDLKLQ